MRKYISCFTLAVSFLLSISTTLIAQSGAQQDEVFRTGVRIVQVPTLVQNKNGEHIPNLKKEDFTILENGKLRQVMFLEEVKPTEGRYSKMTVAPDVFTNFSADKKDVKRFNIIVLDVSNSDFASAGRAKRAMVDYLARSLDGRETVCLILFSGTKMKLIQDFTSDPAILMAAVKKVASGVGQGDLKTPNSAMVFNSTNIANGGVNDPVEALSDFMKDRSMDDVKMLRQNNVLETLERFRHIAKVFGGVPGRKELIWMTTGFPLPLEQPSEVVGKPFAEIFEDTFRALNDAQISLYPVNASGLVANAMQDVSVCDTCNKTNATDRGSNQMARQGQSIDLTTGPHNNSPALNMMADMTGGQAFMNSNDLEKAMRTATKDSAGYYILGYTLDKIDDAPGWRKLQVKANASGGRVRARSGFYMTPAMANPEKVDAKIEVANALRAPFDYTGIAMNGSWGKVTDKNGKREVEYFINVPFSSILIDSSANNHLSLEVVNFVKDFNGNQVSNFLQTVAANLKPENVEQVRKEGLSYRNVIDLAPGDYTVRFVVRDNLTGKIGSVLTGLTVK